MAFSGPLLFLFPVVAVVLVSMSSSSSCLASSSTRKLLVQEPLTQLLRYHNGPLLSGPISINLIWYGKFNPSQRAIISDFISSLTPPKHQPPPSAAPSVAAWWSTTQKYNKKSKSSAPPLTLTLARQISDEAYSIGKKLSQKQIVDLASRGGKSHAVNVVLTASDVVVEGFCSSRCGTHGSARTGSAASKYAYIWVGNSETQCPGQCAWPFHQPIYGPQTPPLLAPNNDVGLDGMVINLGSLLAATATNPFGNGYFQGSADAPLEAASACPGVYGSGAYPGYPGNLLIDPVTGGSYNAQNGMRKYLLPALYDPSTSSCTTLV